MVNNTFYNKSAQNCYKLSFTPFHIKLFDVYPQKMTLGNYYYWNLLVIQQIQPVSNNSLLKEMLTLLQTHLS